MLTNTTAASQSHVSQSWESVVVDDRQKLEVFLGLSVLFGSNAHRSPAVTWLALF